MGKTERERLRLAWEIFCGLLAKKGKPLPRSDGTFVVEQEAETYDAFLRVLGGRDYATKQEPMELTLKGKHLCRDVFLPSGETEWKSIYREVAEDMRWKSMG